MKTFIFYNNSIGDEIIIEKIKNYIGDVSDVECFSGKLDLSKVTPEEHNIIIVVNRNIINFDYGKFLDKVNEDLSKPFIVVKQLKSFCTLFFDKDANVTNISTNKSYPFAGIIYIPKKNFYGRMSDIFNSLQLNSIRYFTIKYRGKK